MVFMFNFQELHIYLSLEPVGEVVVEGVSQHAIDKLLYQFDQSIFLQLVILPQLHVDVLDFVGDLRMCVVKLAQLLFGGQ